MRLPIERMSAKASLTGMMRALQWGTQPSSRWKAANAKARELGWIV
jgi:hypothetical protein